MKIRSCLCEHIWIRALGTNIACVFKVSDKFRKYGENDNILGRFTIMIELVLMKKEVLFSLLKSNFTIHHTRVFKVKYRSQKYCENSTK